MPRIFSVSLVALILTQTASSINAHDGPHGHKHDKEGIHTTRTSTTVIPPAKDEESFQFVVYGDRTGGRPEGLQVLRQAVVDTNLLDPDLVLTVGDLIQGYNETPGWLTQMREYKAIMNGLQMSWFPVAGNHDVYWRGKGPAPEGHHEQNYEKHFGPLWYSFKHKNSGFIVLFSDEGDAATNEKGFNSARLQTMSAEQISFLKGSLEKLKEAQHVFVFLHHPRWIGRGYTGGNWDEVHQMLVDAGNVTAVFAGHIHHMRYDPKDGIQYFTLATTGGSLSAEIPGAGFLHHMNVVTVRPSRISVASLPIGAVFDPKNFTSEFLGDLQLAREIRPEFEGEPLKLKLDGGLAGRVNYKVSNPTQRPIEITASFDSGKDSGWTSTLDHNHLVIQPGEFTEVSFEVTRKAGELTQSFSLPVLSIVPEYIGENARVVLPPIQQSLQLTPDVVPADYFSNATPHALHVTSADSAALVSASQIAIPDGPLTVEAWVKPTALDGFNAIIAKTQSSEYALFSDEGVPQFDIHLDGKYVSAKAAEKLPLNRWTHLAGVFDGEALKLFQDGKVVASVSAAGVRTINQLPLCIGADPDGRGVPTRPLPCFLDEVRVSSSAVYESEFVPQRRLESSERTALLLHFDKRFGPYVLSQTDQPVSATLGTASQLVPLQD